MKLPEDLQKLTRISVIRKGALFLFLSALFCAAVAVCGRRMPGQIGKELLVTGYAAAVVIASLISGFPWKLTDRTWCGTVRRVEIRTTADSSSSSRPTRETLYYKNTVWLTVEVSGGGRQLRRKAWEGSVSAGDGPARYREGDIVFHLSGSPHTVVLPTEKDTRVRCAVCGEENPKDAGNCRSCAHTLIVAVPAEK